MSYNYNFGQDRGRGGGRGRGGFGGNFRGGGGGFRGRYGGPKRNPNPVPMPSSLVDRRYAMQPLPERHEFAQDFGSTSSILNVNHPPTRTHYNNQPTEFPQDRRFFCDPCFRGYQTAYYFQMHLKNHVKCIADGCSFEGLPRVVAKHLLTFHTLSSGSGTVSKSAVDKWLNARKRNFPSHDTVETKERVKQAKLERGEVLENRNAFGKFSVSSLDKEKRGVEDIESDPSISNLQEASAKEAKRQHTVGTKELLEKLLAEDIRHERNVLLQCIRYVINHGTEFGITDTRNETSLQSDGKDKATPRNI